MSTASNSLIKDVPSVNNNDASNPKIELYARDSSNNDDLTVITPNYIPGKTVYRLILSTHETNEAEIDLCLDSDDARLRILEMGEALLVPICKVVRNNVSPTVVNVKEKGRAEKIENDCWHVVKQLYVEFN